MKVLGWLLKAAVFVLIFALALNNQAPVRVHGLFGAQWEAPLALVLLIVLCAGVLLGILVMLPVWWRAHRRARRAADAVQPDAPAAGSASPAPATLADDIPHGV
jgi:uncharacterized integral membrane protein